MTPTYSVLLALFFSVLILTVAVTSEQWERARSRRRLRAQIDRQIAREIARAVEPCSFSQPAAKGWKQQRRFADNGEGRR